MIKIDPYLNVDAGTMSPFEHGLSLCACVSISISRMRTHKHTSLPGSLSTCLSISIFPALLSCPLAEVGSRAFDGWSESGLSRAGETFVLDDGGETDLDLGNYERFLDISLGGMCVCVCACVFCVVLCCVVCACVYVFLDISLGARE